MTSGLGTIVTADQLSARTYPPTDFLVDHLIPKGVTLLAGEPKAGKSWLALDVAASIARGVGCLGERSCPPGDVLYLALEDNEARLHGRLSSMLGSTGWPSRLALTTTWDRIDQGGADAMLDWARSCPRPRAIIVDVFERIRPLAPRSSYQGAYEEISRLREVAELARIGIILVHHLSKGSGRRDAHQRILGTVGVLGAADTSLVMVRGRTNCRLLARGRDIEEVDEIVAFDRQAMCWRPVQGQDATPLFPEQQRIIEFIIAQGRSVAPAEVAAALEIKPGTARTTLRRMDAKGDIIRTAYGTYIVPGHAPANDAA
ncbi:MAG: AAA family ATPase [Bosea sp. (in: a-proteobacteria)]|nr:AAA family ATPase [Bosea sp. (in: a-proteobacteria)]